MSMITLEEAKTYLRVDGAADDSLIESLMNSAEKITTDVARLSATEWDQVCDEFTSEMSIRGSDLLAGEIMQLRSMLKVGVLFALGYLYEHREEADHHELVMTLRSLLSSVREGVF